MSATHKGWLILVVIFFIAVFFRFANYDSRWTLSQDQARDGIISYISLQNHSLPLIGPPSSVGKFSFGPYYYWLIILFSVLAPNVVNASWIGFTFISLLPVVLFYFIGQDLGSKKMGLILALVFAFASGPIFHSVDMLNPIPLIWSVSLVLFCLVRLMEKEKLIYSFFMGIAIGLSINFHFQALGLLCLPFINLIFSKKNRWQIFVLSILGIITTFIPMVIFNFQVNGGLLKNMFESFGSGNNITLRVVPGFIKDLIIFWPQLWGEVLVFTQNFGYIFYIVTIAVLGYGVWKRERINKSILIICLALFIQAIILRFYNGTRTPVYLLIFHPFIIFLTGWSIWHLWKNQKLIGGALLAVFLFLSGWSNVGIMKGFTQKPLIFQIKKQIDEKHLSSIDFYTVKDSGMISLPLYYLLLKEDRISSQGYKIGACSDYMLPNNQPFCPIDPAPFFRRENYPVFDLSTVSDEKIKAAGFNQLTKEEIYGFLTSYYKN